MPFIPLGWVWAKILARKPNEPRVNRRKSSPARPPGPSCCESMARLLNHERWMMPKSWLCMSIWETADFSPKGNNLRWCPAKGRPWFPVKQQLQGRLPIICLWRVTHILFISCPMASCSIRFLQLHHLLAVSHHALFVRLPTWRASSVSILREISSAFTECVNAPLQK